MKEQKPNLGDITEAAVKALETDSDAALKTVIGSVVDLMPTDLKKALLEASLESVTTGNPLTVEASPDLGLDLNFFKDQKINKYYLNIKNILPLSDSISSYYDEKIARMEEEERARQAFLDAKEAARQKEEDNMFNEIDLSSTHNYIKENIFKEDLSSFLPLNNPNLKENLVNYLELHDPKDAIDPKTGKPLPGMIPVDDIELARLIAESNAMSSLGSKYHNGLEGGQKDKGKTNPNKLKK